MAELKLPRLLAAATEFNIGQDTLVDFLAKKGFNKDELKPTAKLSEQMYYALQAEFQSDKVAKNKADLVEIPKAGGEARKRKEDEEIHFKKEEKKPLSKDEPKAEVVKPVEEPIEVKPAPIVEVKKIQPVEEQKPIIETSDIVKIEAPELEGPKVLNKIDLAAIDSSTRPKKGAKKKTVEPGVENIVPPAATPNVKPKSKKTEEPIAAPVVEEIASQESAADENNPVIENIQAEKLTGPKILGKIELPVDSDTRPKPGAKEEQRKRKRIPLDKKGGVNIQRVDFRKDGGGQGQQPAQGGGQNRGGQGGPNRGGQQGPNRGGPSAPARTGPRVTITMRREDKEIDAKDIKDKIKETQAKLAGGAGRGKSLKAKYRRELQSNIIRKFYR